MKCEIDKTVKIEKFVDIEESPRGTLLRIGAGSVVDNFVKFKPVGGSGNILIGKNVSINSGCVFYSGNGIEIGDNVLIGPNCNFVPVNHEYADKNKIIKEQRFMTSKGGIKIGNDVWIASQVTLVDGAIVPDGCVIGACSLVNSKLEPYGVYLGVPAKKVGSRQ